MQNPVPAAALFAACLSLLSLAPAATAQPVMGPQIQVNESTSDQQYLPQVAVFPDGGFVVVWVASPKATAKAAAGVATAPSVLHARLFAADGTPAGGEFLLARPQGRLDGVAAAGNDRFAVAWDGAAGTVQQVYVQMFHRTGKPLTAPVAANRPNAADRYLGIVAGKPDGKVVVAWAANVAASPPYQLYNDAVARIFSPQLVPLTGELTLAAGSPSDGSGPVPDAIAFAPDGALVATLTYDGDGVAVFAARINSKGAALPIDSPFPADCCIANTYDSDLAMAPDGSFTMVWDYTTPVPLNLLPVPPSPPLPIDGRFFAADGAPQGDALITVNRRPLGVRTTPKVAWEEGADGSGGFVSVWVDDSGRDGDGAGIFGRLLGADGTPYGGEFQVNVSSAGSQDQVQLASGPQGAVAVWVNETDTDVYARIVGRR
jgi:hypothetical protein